MCIRDSKRGNAVSSEGFFRGALSNCQGENEQQVSRCTESYICLEYAQLLQMWENRMPEAEKMQERSDALLRATGFTAMPEARLVWPFLREQGVCPPHLLCKAIGDV
eukprot:TRINITY_DN10913_c0_g1_i3.p2 TRINITY_DN10913_c0_g1~~TRINITY_DN10913_c0_g1_i3.p2  ORF type:complete len:107 (-),score=41.25 TRINITY_DN10913_c0_g1_i3:124-444(-)